MNKSAKTRAGSPRKFSEKIALLNKKEAEVTAEFERIIKEVEETTRVPPTWHVPPTRSSSWQDVPNFGQYYQQRPQAQQQHFYQQNNNHHVQQHNQETTPATSPNIEVPNIAISRFDDDPSNYNQQQVVAPTTTAATSSTPTYQATYYRRSLPNIANLSVSNCYEQLPSHNQNRLSPGRLSVNNLSDFDLVGSGGGDSSQSDFYCADTTNNLCGSQTDANENFLSIGSEQEYCSLPVQVNSNLISGRYAANAERRYNQTALDEPPSLWQQQQQQQQRQTTVQTYSTSPTSSSTNSPPQQQQQVADSPQQTLSASQNSLRYYSPANSNNSTATSATTQPVAIAGRLSSTSSMVRANSANVLDVYHQNTGCDRFLDAPQRIDGGGSGSQLSRSVQSCCGYLENYAIQDSDYYAPTNCDNSRGGSQQDVAAPNDMFEPPPPFGYQTTAAPMLARSCNGQ